MRMMLGGIAIVNIAQAEDKAFGGVVAFHRPACRSSRLVHHFFFREIALEHRCQAVHVAAPVELARWLQVSAPSSFQRIEQSRRLIVVVGFPSQRQRGGESLARYQRKGEVDHRQLVEARIKQQPRCDGIELRGPHRDAYVVTLDVQMDDMQLVDFLERQQRVMRKRPPVRAILEDMTVSFALPRNREDGSPLVDCRAGIVGLHMLRSAENSSIELHDLGHAAHTMSDEPRENPPFPFGPLSVVAADGLEEALGVASSLAGGHRFTKYLDMLAGCHFQATSAKHSIDLFRGHDANSACMCRNSLRRGFKSLRTTSTEAASTLPRRL